MTALLKNTIKATDLYYVEETTQQQHPTTRCVVVVQACMLHHLILMTILSPSHQAHIRALRESEGVSAFVQSGELIQACTT